MVPDVQGNFIYSFQTSEYTSYTASARMYCGDLEFSTGNVTLNFGNTSPVANPADLDVKKVIWPFFGRSYSTNVSSFFSDTQDSTLSYSVVSSQLVQDSFTFDGQTGQLDVNLGASRSGTLVIQATDSQGATAQMNLNFRITDLTYWISGTLLIILLVIAVIAASAVAAVMNIPWHGELTVRNLSTGIDKVHADFRGTLPLKKLNLGKCTVDGKFKSVGRNNLMFVSKKEVYTSKTTSTKAAKKVTLTSGTTSIYHDEAKTSGITITVVPRTNKVGGFGGMGGMGGHKPRRGGSNTSKNKVKSNPFA